MADLFDLSYPIENDMVFYPGDPQPRLQTITESGSPWRVTSLSIGSHTGTHIDAASHFIPQAKSIDQYPLDRFLLQGIVVSLPSLGDNEIIRPTSFQDSLKQLKKGGAVLIRTGWDQYWKQERYYHHPYLSTEVAQLLVEAGAGLVGIDALNVDSTEFATDSVHQVLLGNDVLIVENLRGLEQLHPGKSYQFSFLPLFLLGVDGSPVRAVAWTVNAPDESISPIETGFNS